MTSSSKDAPSVVIRFINPSRLDEGKITRVLGLLEPRFLASLLDNIKRLVMANPRLAKRSAVTKAIEASINDTPETLPFKTKGILLGASKYRKMERDRWALSFRGDTEGVLDGGHNLLAVGVHLLRCAMQDDPDCEKTIRKISDWDSFVPVWDKHREQVQAVVEDAKDGEGKFRIPAEVLLPQDPDDDDAVREFRAELFEICAARNNNAQLTSSTKANQIGFYSGIQAAFPDDLKENVEWKDNDQGDIRVHDIISLAWIPLNLLLEKGALKAAEGKSLPSPLSPMSIYSRKGACVDAFSALADALLGEEARNGDYRRNLSNDLVGGAFDILARLPELHDLLYMELPEAYKSLRGRFGNIRYVDTPDSLTPKGKRRSTKGWKTPYYGRSYQEYRYPPAYVVPLTYGLQSLMKVEDGRIDWAVRDPAKFVREHLPTVISAYKDLMGSPGIEYDPQKVGKSDLSYTLALNGFRSALVESEWRQQQGKG